MTHSVILSVPRMAPVRPSAAPAIIKSIIQNHGHTARVFDINLDYWTVFRDNTQVELFTEIDDHLFLPNRVIGEAAAQHFHSFIDAWITRIINEHPERIFISIFTWQAQRFTESLLQRLRPRCQAEVIIGGQGLIYAEHGSYGRPEYAHRMHKAGLIDHWIRGEAETTIPEILRGRYDVPGIDSDELARLSDVRQHSFMDFDDFEVHRYQSGFDHGVLPMETSRGCFRKCVFCDIPTLHGGFRSKQGDQLAQELIHYHERHGVRNFFFHDALCNGDIPEFRRFNQALIDYYRSHGHPDRYLSYSSHAVIYNAKNFTAADMVLMGRAGADAMVVGVETGSDRLRRDMKKGFTNRDLDFTLEHYSRNGIKMYMLMIVGFPTETDADFQETLDMLTRYQRYVADGTIIGVNFNTTYTIEEGSTVARDTKRWRIVGLTEHEKPHGTEWLNLDNPDLTYKQRIMRRIAAQEHAVALGYTFWKGDDQMKILMERYRDRLSRYAGVIH
jgi:hypothetical protein